MLKSFQIVYIFVLPAFLGFVLRLTRGLSESALDEKYSEDTEMLLLQLKCTVLASALD